MSKKRDEEREVVYYMYVKDGKECFTPNEQIAAQRSDTGEYFIIKDHSAKN